MSPEIKSLRPEDFRFHRKFKDPVFEILKMRF